MGSASLDLNGDGAAHLIDSGIVIRRNGTNFQGLLEPLPERSEGKRKKKHE